MNNQQRTVSGPARVESGGENPLDTNFNLIRKEPLPTHARSSFAIPDPLSAILTTTFLAAAITPYLGQAFQAVQHFLSGPLGFASSIGGDCAAVIVGFVPWIIAKARRDNPGDRILKAYLPERLSSFIERKGLCPADGTVVAFGVILAVSAAYGLTHAILPMFSGAVFSVINAVSQLPGVPAGVTKVLIGGLLASGGITLGRFLAKEMLPEFGLTFELGERVKGVATWIDENILARLDLLELSFEGLARVVSKSKQGQDETPSSSQFFIWREKLHVDKSGIIKLGLCESFDNFTKGTTLASLTRSFVTLVSAPIIIKCSLDAGLSYLAKMATVPNPSMLEALKLNLETGGLVAIGVVSTGIAAAMLYTLFSGKRNQVEDSQSSESAQDDSSEETPLPVWMRSGIAGFRLFAGTSMCFYAINALFKGPQIMTGVNLGQDWIPLFLAVGVMGGLTYLNRQNFWQKCGDTEQGEE